jgi:hypothetical protein
VFVLRLSVGPLKILRFRLAKIMPGDGGEMVPKAAPPSLSGARTTRTLEGKVEFVGVAGRTLTEVWGDFVRWPEIELGEVMLIEDVDEVLEWE